MTKLCIDVDYLLFQACPCAEKRSVSALHVPTNKKYKFETRSDLWGNWHKKSGGWIAFQNEILGEEFYKVDDFVITDKQIKLPIQFAYNVIDAKIKKLCEILKTNNYYGYTGRGKVFRHDVATLMEYKGQRTEMLKPLHLDNVKDYLIEKHNTILVTGIEADDAISIDTIEAYKKWKTSGKDDDKVIATARDKDSKQTEGWHFNIDHDTQPRLIEGFGKLWLDGKDVDGCGRMWLYYQILAGDQTDNYKPNCFSELRWGSKSAYKALVKCKNDKQAIQALVDSFKLMYPTKQTITGWRGDVFEIDYMYVLQEMWSLAMMLRHKNDKVDVKQVCDKLGVNYA